MREFKLPFMMPRTAANLRAAAARGAMMTAEEKAIIAADDRNTEQRRIADERDAAEGLVSFRAVL